MADTPVLRQSVYETMACPHSYALIHIEGKKPPDTIASTRGRDIHEIMAAYSEHCAAKRVSMDLAYFDGLLLDTGEEAAEIMRSAGDSITVDHQNFFAAELSMGMDENFAPTYSLTHDGQPLPPDPIWNIKGSEKPPRYSAILDDIALFPGGKSARIRDFKSHPRPFDPTTFQAKLYSLMLFMHMPELVEVEFVLVFVRYTNIVRPIKFTRDQVPELKDEVRRARARQDGYHQTYREEGLEAMPALSGTHCTYCPAVQDFSCPIAKLNPMLNISPEERLRFRLWYSAASRANNAALSQMVDGTQEPITATDANGKNYTFGPVRKDKTVYPLFTWNPAEGLRYPLIEKLVDWATTDAPEDCLPSKRSPIPWLANLRVGSTELNKYLKAGKRADLHQWVVDNVQETKSTVELRVTKDPEVDDGSDDFEEDAQGNVAEWES